jgi:hypothetical protein
MVTQIILITKLPGKPHVGRGPQDAHTWSDSRSRAEFWATKLQVYVAKIRDGRYTE